MVSRPTGDFASAASNKTSLYNTSSTAADREDHIPERDVPLQKDANRTVSAKGAMSSSSLSPPALTQVR